MINTVVVVSFYSGFVLHNAIIQIFAKNTTRIKSMSVKLMPGLSL